MLRYSEMCVVVISITCISFSFIENDKKYIILILLYSISNLLRKERVSAGSNGSGAYFIRSRK